MEKAFHTIVILMVALSATTGHAANNNGTVAFVLDNDLFVGTDQKYTNGVRFSWLDASAAHGGHYSTALSDALSFLPIVGNQSARHSASITLTQIMATPDDLTATELLPDQAPYFGYAELGTSLYTWDSDKFRAIGLSVGVIGPDSRAEQTQKFVHRVMGSQRPEGWQNQIGRRYTADINYLAGYRAARHISQQGMGWDATLNYGITLGSPLTTATGAVLLRFGRNLPNNFNTYFADGGGESALLGLTENPHRTGWQLHAGIAGNVIGYNAIDREARSSHNIDAERLSASLMLGGSYYIKRVQVGVSLQADTSPAKQDKTPISYGSVYLIWTG